MTLKVAPVVLMCSIFFKGDPKFGCAVIAAYFVLKKIAALGRDLSSTLYEEYRWNIYCKKHLISPVKSFPTSLTQRAFCRAFKRLRTFPSYAWYVKSKEFQTISAAKKQFLKNVNDGTCYGQCATLFHLKQQCSHFTFEQSIDLMHPEEVLFRQMVQDLGKHVRKLLKNKQDAEIEAEKARLIEVDPLLAMKKGTKFSPEVPWTTYQEKLEEIAHPKRGETIEGVVSMPVHVLAFQCGHQGYHIYDTFLGAGMSTYHTSQAFFENLRLILLRNLEKIKEEDKITRVYVRFRFCHDSKLKN